MFDSVEKAPADPIMGIMELYNKDPNPHKINLSMGIFKNEAGVTPILPSVREAEQRIFKNEVSKSYSGIEGFSAVTEAILSFVFGDKHEAVTSSRARSLHTPGGSGALRVIGNFLRKFFPESTIWVSDPTWANHLNIFKTAGFSVKKYPYFDSDTNGLAFEKMMTALKKIPQGDIVLFHGCCHNPTGVDPSIDQWKDIADLVHSRGLIPILDFAYQGFSQGIREDARGPLELVRPGFETFICGSFSKNFALYNERVGSLTVVARNQKVVETLMSQIKIVVRSIYSSPPAHGGFIVSTILKDPDLRSQWETELKGMRDRIQDMRALLVKTLTDKGFSRDTSFITAQNGMFSFSGLSEDQVLRLRNEHSVYIVGNGRINVAAITPHNVEPLCGAIVQVS